MKPAAAIDKNLRVTGQDWLSAMNYCYFTPPALPQLAGEPRVVHFASINLRFDATVGITP